MRCLVLLCAVSFAAHILVTARAVREHDVGALLAVQLGVCGVACLAIAGPAGQLEAPAGWTVWSALIVTSLVASALGFFMQTYAQQHAPPQEPRSSWRASPRSRASSAGCLRTIASRFPRSAEPR